MSIQAKKPEHPRHSGKSERPVIYRGVKITPMSGKRSPLAEAIRKDLQSKSELSVGDFAKA